MAPTKKYNLTELQEYIQQVVALNFPKAVWVKGELSQAKVAKGHMYIDLVEKKEGAVQITAQANAVLWAKTFARLRRAHGFMLDQVLQEGMQVMLLVRVDFHPRYGMKLVIDDVDTNFTMGQLALKRQEVIKRLKKEGLLDLNKALVMSPVPQRIALISTERAAGYHDFTQQLSQNPQGYRFECTLFEASMQGNAVVAEVSRQLKRVNAMSNRFDVVCIVRGGGAKLDLAAFDDYEICNAVSACYLPVLTGIGHEVDETAIDLAAHSSLKTPTALAQFLIERCMVFESEMVQMVEQVHFMVRDRLHSHSLLLEQQAERLRRSAGKQLSEESFSLDHLLQNLPRTVKHQMKIEKLQLDALQKNLDLLSVDHALKRGFSMLLKNGKAINSVDQLKKGDNIVNRLSDGEIESEIK